MSNIGEHFSNLKPFFGSTGTKVMITTGSTTKTEVVDVVSGQICAADLADFPVQIDGAVGANLHGIPIVCGDSRKCYNFKNGSWKQFTTMKEKREQAAGVMYKSKFYVFGGFDSSLLQTSEIISIDGGVEYGPDLPEAVYQHAVTSINSTVSILSGGQTSTNSYSPLTWYLDHETLVFSSGPSLLEARRLHGSATIVDKVMKTKIAVVTGGQDSNGYLQSTEMLNNGQWQSGTIQCKKATFSCFALI